MKIWKFIKTKRFIFALAIFISALAYFLFLNYQKTTTQTTRTQRESSKVKVLKGDVKSSVTASGTVQTANYLPITTSVNGIVKAIFVKEGDKVKKGQKIMEITLDQEGEKAKTSAYASYLKAKTSLDSARNSLLTYESAVIQKEQAFETEKENNTYQSDDERNAFKIGENDLQKAKSEYDIKKAELTALQLTLSASWMEYQSQSPVITAPSDGVIANIVSVEGNKIENSVSEKSVKTVASIKLTGTPIVSVNVTEVDISSIKVGQKVDVTLNALDKIFNGEVVGIDKIGTTSSGVPNYPVIIKLTDESDIILPNMTVEAEIINEIATDVLYVPTSAVTTAKDKSYVNIVGNGTRNRVEVVTGLKGDKYIEIKLGLAEGDEIAVNALPTTGFTTTGGQNNVRIGVPGFGATGR